MSSALQRIVLPFCVGLTFTAMMSLRCLASLVILLVVQGLLATATDPSNAVTFPRNVHIAVTGDVTEMVISWWTRQFVPNSVVQWGQEHGQLLNSTAASAVSYNTTLAGWCYHALLTGLKPDETYAYRVGSQDTSFSQQFTFSSAPSTIRPFTILTYGDMGVRESEQTIMRVLQEVEQNDIDLIYHVGDISYADDQDCNVYEYVWTEYLDLIQEAAASIPYMTCPGNHEYSCNYKQADQYQYTMNFTAYNARFQMPSASSNGTQNMWFSFNFGNIHFISIDTETDYPDAPEGSHMFGDQLLWLEADLASVDRKLYPWIIATGHRPMYSTLSGFSDEATGQPLGDPKSLLNAMEGLFKAYNVDLFVVGHVHAYERMYPTFNGTRTSEGYENPPSTVHIVNGAGGNQESPSIYSSTYPLGQNWLAHRYSGWGYGKVIVTSSTSLTWEFYRADDGKLEDTFTITKTATA